MSSKKLRLLADSLERGFMTEEDRRGWVSDLQGMAKNVERSVMVEPSVSNEVKPIVTMRLFRYDFQHKKKGRPNYTVVFLAETIDTLLYDRAVRELKRYQKDVENYTLFDSESCSLENGHCIYVGDQA